MSPFPLRSYARVTRASAACMFINAERAAVNGEMYQKKITRSISVLPFLRRDRMRHSVSLQTDYSAVEATFTLTSLACKRQRERER